MHSNINQDNTFFKGKRKVDTPFKGVFCYSTLSFDVQSSKVHVSPRGDTVCTKLDMTRIIIIQNERKKKHDIFRQEAWMTSNCSQLRRCLERWM